MAIEKDARSTRYAGQCIRVVQSAAATNASSNKIMDSSDRGRNSKYLSQLPFPPPNPTPTFLLLFGKHSAHTSSKLRATILAGWNPRRCRSRPRFDYVVAHLLLNIDLKVIKLCCCSVSSCSKLHQNLCTTDHWLRLSVVFLHIHTIRALTLILTPTLTLILTLTFIVRCVRAGGVGGTGDCRTFN